MLRLLKRLDTGGACDCEPDAGVTLDDPNMFDVGCFGWPKIEVMLTRYLFLRPRDALYTKDKDGQGF